MMIMSQGHENAMNVDCAGPVGELQGRSMPYSGQFKKTTDLKNRVNQVSFRW